MKILAIPGSLRKNSTNKSLLRAAASLLPDGMEILHYDGIGQLPHFNPDLEGHEPATVTEFKQLVGESDGLLISSPEYAHGVPGSLKNALDWLVGGSEMVGKPVALFNASPRAAHAQVLLQETLKTMSARVIPEAYLEVPLLGKTMTAEEMAAHPVISKNLRASLEALAGKIRKVETGG